jgi:competence protein ComEC
VYKWFGFKNKWADKLWALCSVSIAAQVITFPLSAFYFHQFPVYFLMSNIFIIIPSAVIMYSGILYLLLPQIPVVSAVLAFILEKSILLMNKVLAVIEHAPFASIGKIWLTTPEYLLLYIIIISLFYFLYDKKLWLIKFSLLCPLFLCASFSFKNISSLNSNTITFLNLKKHRGIVFKNGREAVVLSDIKATDKTYQYSIQPYLDSCKVSNVKVLDLNHDIKTPCLIKRYNLIQFLNKRVLIVNGQFQNSPVQQKLATDYVYVTGNAASDLSSINNILNYKTFVMDGSNSDNLISKVEKQAKTEHIDFKILKRNNSLVSISN